MAYITSPLLADTSTTRREDLANTIAMVDPTSFPLFWLLEHKGCSSIEYDWLMDFIPFISEVQSSPEGQQASGLRVGAVDPLASEFDAYPGVTGSPFTSTNEDSYRRTRGRNTTTLLMKLVSISGSQQSSNEAGVADEYAHQVYRVGTAALQQQEHNLHWSTYQDGQSGNSYTRQLHGLVPWIMSTGFNNSNPTIAGKAIPNYYSSSAWYRPTWLPISSVNADTDEFGPTTANSPWTAFYDPTQAFGSEMQTWANGYAIPRIRLFGGTGAMATDDGAHTTATVTSSTSIDTGTATDYGDADVSNADFSTNMTRAQFYDYVLQPAYIKGMRIGGSIMLCPAAVKRLVNDFAHVYGSGTNQGPFLLNTRTIDAGAKKLIDAVDVFETTFGPVAIHLDRYFESGANYDPAGSSGGFFDASYTNGNHYHITPNKSFVLFEPDYAKIRPYADRGFFHEDLGKQGDSLEGQIISEIGFECSNPRAFAGGFGVVQTEA